MHPRKRQAAGGNDGTASTSRAALGSSRNDHVDEFHPGYYGINMPSPSARKKWDRLVQLKHHQCRFLCQETCQAMGIINDATYLAERAGLYEVMMSNHLAYCLLTLEFLSTVNVHKNLGRPDSLTFQLKNNTYELTINELNDIVGGVGGGSCSVDMEDIDDDIWAKITDESVEAEAAFDPTTSKASSIRNLAFRYFHRLLIFTVYAKTNAGTC